MKKLQDPIYILGSELRTTNDNGRSFKDIPLFWQRFMQENVMEKIPHRLGNDIYAVYTHFENEGQNNKGMYSLIIGYRVEPTVKVPAELTTVIIPSGKYRVFPVEKGRPDKVGEAWQAIWAISDKEKQEWRFSCDYEHYTHSGEINIYIGVAD